jgi:hypothetical protein
VQYRANRRGAAFRVLARMGVDAWNRVSVMRSERRDALGVRQRFDPRAPEPVTRA